MYYLLISIKLPTRNTLSSKAMEIPYKLEVAKKDKSGFTSLYFLLSF